MEYTQGSIERARSEHPDEKVVVHPECSQAVRLLADEICSTEKMIGYCRESPAHAFVIVTEEGMLHRLRREVPGKVFIPGPTDHCACAECRYMKKNTLEKLYLCLRDLKPEILLEEGLRARAEKSVRRMMELSK
jgi:quinolinate synthase